MVKPKASKATHPAKAGVVMREFYKKTLHSGSKKGPLVKSLAQAKAIAASEAGYPERSAPGVVSGRVKRSANNPKTFAGRRAASHAKLR